MSGRNDNVMSTHLTRRNFLRAAGKLSLSLLTASSLLTFFRQAYGGENEGGIGVVLRRHFGGRSIDMSRVDLKVPIIAENGAVVPLTVATELPVRDDLYVKKIYIFVDQNLNPYVAGVELTPFNGKAEVAMRIKMRKTSNVRAVVEMSDGRLYGDIKSVKVTKGGCGGV